MQRYFSNKKVENDFYLEEQDLHHIKNVMRMKTDEFIEVVYEKNVYLCKLQIQNDLYVASLTKVLPSSSHSHLVTLIIPLLKENKMDLILQKSTELGVQRIIPYIAERSIIKLDSKKEETKRKRWQTICKEASEQSKQIDIPFIEKVHMLKELQSMDGMNLICSTTEKEKNIKFFLHSSKNCGKINIIIGPEGGFSEKEENTLVAYGFEKMSLGHQILRVETVPIFLMSIINYEYME